MWTLCHGALQGFAFILLGYVTASATHLDVSSSFPLRSWIDPVKGKKNPASSTIYQYILIIPNNCLSTVS